MFLLVFRVVFLFLVAALLLFQLIRRRRLRRPLTRVGKFGYPFLRVSRLLLFRFTRWQVSRRRFIMFLVPIFFLSPARVISLLQSISSSMLLMEVFRVLLCLPMVRGRTLPFPMVLRVFLFTIIRVAFLSILFHPRREDQFLSRLRNEVLRNASLGRPRSFRPRLSRLLWRRLLRGCFTRRSATARIPILRRVLRFPRWRDRCRLLQLIFACR